MIKYIISFLAFIPIAMLGIAEVYNRTSDSKIVFSPQSSIGVGFYKVSACDNSKLMPGDMIYFENSVPDIFPKDIIPRYDHLLKYIGGLPGYTISVTNEKVNVCLKEDCMGLPLIPGMPSIGLPSTIPEGMVFTYGTSLTSFDSRYFGLVNKTRIKGCGQSLYLF